MFGRFGRSACVRRGSALLIVLGMLSFMVVSAVGFSIFMRQSRAPSSYLRRNVAARYLVKAALANAIEDLDCGWMSCYDIGESDSNHESGRLFGICDDPYPGCGADAANLRDCDRDFYDGGNDVHVQWCENGNLWCKRVFCPFGPLVLPDNDGDHAVDYPPLTAPTLTLEALAYLPPAIADDVRQMSRATRTAQWHMLPNEAGRYAYTAVNVSDLFDINRLRASDPRDSGLNRITLATLFPKKLDDPIDIDTGAAKNFDDHVLDPEQNSELKIGGNYVPYVSLADFALRNANEEVGTKYSPFTKYIGSSGDSLLQGSKIEEANSLFITDTWFPASNAVNGVTYDLAGGHQPFKAGAFSATPCPDIFEARNRRNDKDNVGEILEKNLGIGLACLYDYLDRDSQPLSLCLPTTEATPMILGISSPAALQPEIGQIDEETGTSPPINGKVNAGTDKEESATAVIKRTAKKMGITKFGDANNVQIKVMAAYPFKRMNTTGRTKDFQLRGVMRIFLGQPGLKSRLLSAKIPSFANANDWPNGGNANAVVANGVATFFSEEMSLKRFSFLSGDNDTWDKAVEDNIPLKFQNMKVQMPIYWQVEESWGNQSVPGTFVSTEPDSNARTTPFKSFGKLENDQNVLRPFDDAGNFHAGWTANGAWNLNAKANNDACTEADSEPVIANDVKFRLQVAIWLQVLDGQKVVDMVPASYVDDEIWLNADNTRGRNENINQMGDGMPLLSFSASTDISYKTIESDLQQMVEFTDAKALYAVDPRFNWAPEGWWANAGDRVSKNTWHDEIENLWGTGGRDRDIFMFVSDQEYLQDIGELQFLPYLQEMNGSGNFNRGDYSPTYHGEALTARMTAAAAVLGFEPQGGLSFLWRTYTAYDNGDGWDPIYALPPNATRIHSGGNGFKLNPYSDDDRVLFAALVGTPFDYYVASTNDDPQVKSSACQDIDLDKMMSQFSFGESDLAELKDREIEDIGDAIRATLRGATGGGDAWESLMNLGRWQDDAQKCDENLKFLGQTLGAALHGVDRKFLASYWRECFDNRQQLFLIFVRAEPTAVGGGSAGNVASAQLGGRAVALVWRDPAPASGATVRNRPGGTLEAGQFREDFKDEHRPHDTRILFYHQFD